MNERQNQSWEQEDLGDIYRLGEQEDKIQASAFPLGYLLPGGASRARRDQELNKG